MNEYVKGVITAFGMVLVGSLIALPMIPETPAHATPSPDILSIRFQNEDTAWDFWRESRSLGEKTCLTELNDGGLRYWLHSCETPRFTNSPSVKQPLPIISQMRYATQHDAPIQKAHSMQAWHARTCNA